MNKGMKKSVVVLAILLAVIFVFMTFANLIQKDFGKVNVTTEYFNNGVGDICYKLYVPEGVDANNKAPAVLCLHGYQNDKETNAGYALELARRGYVVMSIDEYGHGYNSAGLVNRGYVNKKVTVNYGEEVPGETQVSIGGQTRYKVMMNFSNLSFFNDVYTKDDDGNVLTDSSMGGIDAYAYLASLDYVDDTNIGVTGHSMGTWATWSVAAAYSGAKNSKGEDISPKAIVIQCGELFRKSAYDSDNIKFNNVLLLQAKWDEFSYFRDYKDIVSDELLSTDLRLEFFGLLGKQDSAKWNTTYGNFADGSARKIQLLYTNHRLTTHNREGLAVALDWFDAGLNHTSALDNMNHTFKVKEYLVFGALLCAVFSFIPLIFLLLNIPYFKDLKQSVPSNPAKLKKGKGLWRGIIITMLIACFTYPFMTQLGHGLLPLPEGIFRMTIGNGFFSWYLLLDVVMIVTMIIGFKKGKKNGNPIDWYDLGLARENKKEKIDWGMFGKSALLVGIVLVYLEVLLWITQALYQLDLRFIWPFLKAFTFERFLQFLVYIPFFGFFFILNNSKIFASMKQEETLDMSFKAGVKVWGRSALMMIGGIIIMCLIEYIPFFANIGPGADLLFSSTFGGPFMSLLIVFVPQVIVFSIICTIIYRRTNNVYITGLTVASIACWIVTSGSAML